MSALADHGADLNQCLKELISHFRDLTICKTGPDLMDTSETKSQHLATQSEGVSMDRLINITRILEQTERDIKHLGYERLNLELALVKLSSSS